MASYISLPIHRLHQGTEIIASGNLDYKVGIDNKDEIGQLSRAFDQMTVDLKKSQEDLKGWGQTLEERVKERTKELNQAQEATLNILEDLTEEKEKVSKYSRDLENAIKVKSDFTSMVSHELRIAIVSDGSA
ncbi:MAG: HAMP domain-containing protein, partial [Candidatus Omnitrophica bacterium]|nr:HAMP domain-containing protein [Candidatus Omnitrophota bacterium]